MNSQSILQEILSKIQIRGCKMKGKWMIIGNIVALLLLVLAAGLTQAQGPQPPGGEVGAEGGVSVTAAVLSRIPIQGRLTDASGNPLNGTYTINFYLYDALTGGNLVCYDDVANNVPVSNGLFTWEIWGNCDSNDLTGQQLYLEIRVAGETLSPRQPIYPVPYAFSLKPGAYITDTKDFPDYILKVDNGGTGRAIWASTAGHTALEGWNSNPSSGVGVWGGSAGTGGFGVFGYAAATSGVNFGVAGQSESTEGRGVNGYVGATSGTTYGVYGTSLSTSGTGVYGEATATSGNTYGVWGVSRSTSGIGVSGWATATSGTNYGVFGRSDSTDGRGVYGSASATSGTNYGVCGRTNSPDGWAGYFYTYAGNGVYITAPPGKTGLNVASGTKSAVVRSNDGSRLLYTEESTEVWFTDYGFGKLQNGAAVITIDPVFAQTVNLNEPYHVFVQAYGNASLYVTNRTPTSFEVRLHDGDPNVEFSYRIVAKRLGYEAQRLERAPWADNDPNLYPEKRATWEAQQGGEP
jgi:hypothetical protein